VCCVISNNAWLVTAIVFAAALANPKRGRRPGRTLRWLQKTCDLDELKPGHAETDHAVTHEGIVTESLGLSVGCRVDLSRDALAQCK